MLRTADEQVFLDARRHGIVLLRPLLKAGAAATAGAAGVVAGWPVSPAGVGLLALAALVAVRAVWRWDRTHVVLTSDKLFVVHGVVRRRAAAVHLARLGAVEIEQSLVGRVLGYGTICAGELEISYVRQPREIVGLVSRLAA
jgi:membrane protein YdbS with pleckstrin-like domain